MHSILCSSPCPSGYPPIIAYDLSRHVLTFLKFFLFFAIFRFFPLFPLYFSPCIIFTSLFHVTSLMIHFSINSTYFPLTFWLPPIIEFVLSCHVLTFSIFCIFFDIFDFLYHVPLYFPPCVMFAYFSIFVLLVIYIFITFLCFRLYFCLPPHFPICSFKSRPHFFDFCLIFRYFYDFWLFSPLFLYLYIFSVLSHFVSLA